MSDGLEKPLDPDRERAIGTCKHNTFHGLYGSQQCAHELMRDLRLKSNVTWEVAYWSIVSALTRRDYDCVRRYVRDFSDGYSNPVRCVSKFVPGDHFHVLGRKFDTLGEAIRHLESKGYRFGHLEEKHVYTRDGD